MMWAVSLLMVLVNPVLGAAMLISAAVTTNIKAVKVDAEYARQGKTPPSYGLIDKWLDGRKARGQAPADAKPAKYGMWRYAWQRWQALWEALALDHKLRHEQWLKERAEAAANGEPPPPKPSREERRNAAWQWVIDNVIHPAGKEPGVAQPVVGEAGRPAPDGPRIACDACGVTLVDTAGGYAHPAGSTCPKATDATTNKPVPAQADTRWECPGCGLLPDRPSDAGRYCRACSADAAQPSGTRPAAPTLENLPAPPWSPLADDQPTEGDDMPAAPNRRSGEVTGIPSAIHYEREMAAAHRNHADNEALVASLAAMKVGPGDLNLVRKAIGDSLAAAEAFERAADLLEKNNAAVREAYGSAPDAADKQHQVA